MNYFRHYVSKNYFDIIVSATVFSGDPLIYVSIDPLTKKPDSSHNNYNYQDYKLG